MSCQRRISTRYAYFWPSCYSTNGRQPLDHPVSTRFDTLASRAPKLPELLANQRRVGENEKRPSSRWVATASSMQRSAPFKSYPRGFPQVIHRAISRAQINLVGCDRIVWSVATEQRRILDRRMLTNSGETRIARILRSCRSSCASHRSDSGVGKVEAECASGAVAVTAQSKNFNRPSLSGPCLLTIP